MSSSASFVAAGDIFITRRLPEKGYPGLFELSQFLSGFDVRFGNLETTIHSREGYPFGFSGGTWAMSEPAVLDDLAAYYGFNLYNAANNHSMDYSHNGLLATMRSLTKRGMRFAGVGEQLADAAAPVYLECQNARVALVAATSTFHESWAAGNQSREMKGRPGVNPLRFSSRYHVTQAHYDTLVKLADEIDINAQRNLDIKEGFAVASGNSFSFGGHEFVPDNHNAKHTAPHKGDLARILASIKEGKKQADYVVVSIHSHELLGEEKVRPAEFLRDFSKACIDAGAVAVLGHGPHILRGIECYHGGVIFYSLGNFLFQNDTVSHLPADFYEKYSLPEGSMVGDGMDNRSKNGTIGLGVDPDVWRSVLASFSVKNGRLLEVRLHPIEMGFSLPRYRKGLPALCSGRGVLEHLAALSLSFGTTLRMEDTTATVVL